MKEKEIHFMVKNERKMKEKEIHFMVKNESERNSLYGEKLYEKRRI
jgi:hypothetical protein